MKYYILTFESETVFGNWSFMANGYTVWFDEKEGGEGIINQSPLNKHLWTLSTSYGMEEGALAWTYQQDNDEKCQVTK